MSLLQALLYSLLRGLLSCLLLLRDCSVYSALCNFLILLRLIEGSLCVRQLFVDLALYLGVLSSLFNSLNLSDP